MGHQESGFRYFHSEVGTRHPSGDGEWQLCTFYNMCDSETIQQFLRTSNMELSCNPAILLLGLSPKELKAGT